MEQNVFTQWEDSFDKGKYLFNNNTFSGCLHSKGVVLQVHLSLQGSPITATDVMRYGPSQLGPSFPYAGFLAVPKTFLNTSGLSFTLAS